MIARLHHTLLLFCLALALPGPGPALAAQAQEERTGPIRVGIYNFYPLTHTEGLTDCQAHPPPDSGIFISLLQEIARRERWELRYVADSLPNLLEGLKRGDVDIVVAVTPSREETDLVCTQETVLSTWARVYSRARLSIQSPIDLGGRSVGLIRDDPYNDAVRSLVRRLNIECAFVEFRHYGEILTALEKGWVDAGVVDRLYAALNAPKHAVESTPIVLSPLALHYAARRDSMGPEMAAIDYHLRRMKRDQGSYYHALIERYLSRPEPSPLPRALIYSLAAAVGLLIFLGAMSFLLRLQVKRQTAELSEKNRALEKEIAMRREADESLFRQREYLAALNETTVGLMGRLEIDDVLEAVVSRASRLVGAKHSFVLIHCAETDRLVLQVGQGIFSDQVGAQFSLGEGIAGSVWQTGDPVLVRDYANWDGRLRTGPWWRLRFVMAVPMRSEDTVTGVIGVAHTDAGRSFGVDELDILRRFAELASIAMEKAELYSVLRSELAQRRQAEEELARLGMVIKQSSDSVAITDPQGRVDYVNPAFEIETGQGRHEVRGRTLAEMSDECPLCRIALSMLEDAMREGRAAQGRFPVERPEVAPMHIEAAVSLMRDESGGIRNYVITCRNVTREAGLESQLRQAQKMEAIGTLSGGIAHDFNNLLVPIIGYTEMLSRHADERSQNYLVKILSAATRAKDLVHQILAFSRQSEEERRPLDVERVVRDALRLLRASLPATIEMRERIDPDGPCILGDSSQMHQVVMNLCTNAYHAMRDSGGVLTVTLSARVVDSRNAQPAGVRLESGRYVQLTVADTGHGMDETILARIFDPYFTTKAQGDGTGLGLSIVHGIVQKHGGQIAVHSAVGEGTRFEVYLPATESAALVASDEGEEAPLERGRERLLLVDDEEHVLSMERELLADMGYPVVTCNDSQRALEMVRDDPQRFDLVVTDQTMPGMTGMQLARELNKLRPDLPLLLCTGFTDAVSERRAEELGFRGCLRKPFVRSEMARAVRMALAPAPSASSRS